MRASDVNLEAGDHPVATDPEELAAAVRASDRSFERFPYYRWRYGDRGRRFGHSDGGWLIALCGSPAAFAREQIQWLGVVLSSRGMPRLLLEDHLRLLHQELGGARKYRVLVTAADELRKQRRRHIPDQLMKRCADEFLKAAPQPWRGRIPEMGRLLAAAVADEGDGIERAVLSIEDWATDREQFPAGWIKAVRTTIATARMSSRA